MNIQVRYQTNPLTLARVSLAFIERKPLMRLAIVLFNIIAALFVGIVILKLFVVGSLLFPEIGLGFMCLAWLFLRRLLSEKLLHWRMKKQEANQKTIEVSISKNGVSWGGQGLKQGSLKWPEIKYMLQLRNGYILPAAISKFLWIPYSGFTQKDQRKEFEGLCTSYKIKIKKLNYSC